MEKTGFGNIKIPAIIICERRTGRGLKVTWEKIHMKDIKKGDVYRLFTGDTMDTLVPTVDMKGRREFKAYRDSMPTDDGYYAVENEP